MAKHSENAALATGDRRAVWWLMSGSALSNLADGVLIVALPWLASELTRDALLIAVVTAATRLPWLLFSIPAGVLADRVNRSRLLVGADAIRAMLALVLVALVATVGDAAPASALAVVALLSGVAFALGAAEVVRDNTAQTFLPDLVPASALETQNGRLWSVELLTGQLLAPAIAGGLIAVSLLLPFVLACVAYTLAAVLLWQIRVKAKPVAAPSGWWLSAREGWQWLRGHSQLLRLAFLLGLVNFSAAGLMTILVLYSRELLLLEAGAHGALLAISALGGVLGGWLCPRVVRRFGALPSVWLALTLFALMPIIMGLYVAPWVAAAALFLESFASLLWNVVTVSWRQRHIPASLLGRVNSLYRCAGWGGIAFGALAAGLLVSALESTLGRDGALRAPYLFAGAFNLLLMIWASRWLRLGDSK